MIDLFLVTATEAETNAALLAAGIVDGEGNPPVGISVDHIGSFTRNGVEYADWHTNLRGTFTDEQLAALDPIRIYPTLPYRVFAG
jgi:hypothetical protein